ncbi:MbtH family protein [Streptomyces sp. 8N616]|uniref:MbtH family protein n=1 Tax=Streptomyces sp. 8N616 TaxID=3457414 RepID=UPI003FD33AC4
MSQETNDVLYLVVTNDEEQYSIWPAYRELPAGWQARTPATGKQACLDHIREHWTDMRPRSLREQAVSAEADGHRP